MDETSGHEGSFEKRRLTASDLDRVLAIMGADGRRAFAEVDGDRLDPGERPGDGELAAAGEVDVNSYWSDPAKPQWGRRHFVYLVADRSGVRYFGDSDSPEVRQVCDALRDYFGGPAARATPASAGHWDDSLPSWLHPSGWREPYNRIAPPAVLAALALLLFLTGFLIGRASVRHVPDLATPVALPGTDEPAKVQQPDGAVGPAASGTGADDRRP